MHSNTIAKKAIDFDTIYDNIGSFQIDPKIPFTDYLTFGKIIRQVLPFVYAAAGLILLVLLVFAGYGYMTAGSDAKKAQLAKARLTTALIGFAIVVLSYWMIQIVAQIFGITEITDIFG